ncbi:MAG: DeoR/GlpR family DNA-binding transcription regulator [Phycisphaerae bacterium]
MLANERQRAILRRVQETGGARVTELARELQVAEETIRRDLEKLDTDGKLLRTHGGAVPLEPDRELPYSIRETANLNAKRAIARLAVSHIREGDVIGLDSSSTVNELARILPDMGVTVITNSLVAAMSLASKPRIRVISTGGQLDGPSVSFVGSLAEDSVSRFNINKLFMSTKGADVQRGLSVAADEHARIKRRMMDFSEQVYLLADHSKFGVRSVVFFAQLNEVRTVITDTGVIASVLDELANQGIRVERAN